MPILRRGHGGEAVPQLPGAVLPGGDRALRRCDAEGAATSRFARHRGLGLARSGRQPKVYALPEGFRGLGAAVVGVVATGQGRSDVARSGGGRSGCGCRGGWSTVRDRRLRLPPRPCLPIRLVGGSSLSRMDAQQPGIDLHVPLPLSPGADRQRSARGPASVTQERRAPLADSRGRRHVSG